MRQNTWLAGTMKKHIDLLFFGYVSCYALVLSCFIYIFTRQHPECMHDECGFWGLSDCIAALRFSFNDGFHIHWPPGWPLLLAISRLFFKSLLAVRLLNVLFIALTLVALRRLVMRFSDKFIATFMTVVYSFYPSNLWDARLSWSESIFCLILVCGVLHYVAYLQDGKIKNLYLGSFFLFYSAMIKAYYGYVLLCSIPVVFAIALLLYRLPVKKASKAVLPLVIAVAMCIPYLAFTYVQTGKVFYWSSNGGQLLYWMSYPQIDNYGNWHSSVKMTSIDELKIQNDFLAKVEAEKDGCRQDQMFKEKALSNIFEYPSIYAQNVIANFGRLVFNYPYAFTSQKPQALMYSIPNSFVFSLFIFSLFLSMFLGYALRLEEAAVIALVLVAMAGHLLIDSVARYFHPLAMLMTVSVGSMVCRIRMCKNPVPGVTGVEDEALKHRE